jgi:acetylornithine/succinyldiaminopimelate/putrescine aminotransferase/predicted amino acid dehydrogenase
LGTLHKTVGPVLRPLRSEDDARHAFGVFLRPRLAQLLSAFSLDIVYHRALGDFLYYRGSEGEEIEVLDMIGGFGASLFGHNNPELVGIARQIHSLKRPFNAQASVRSYAGLLAQELSKRVGETTARSYVVTLASTGSEAVEAAIKHAELERFRRNERLLEQTREGSRKLRIRLGKGNAFLPKDFFEKASNTLGGELSDSVEDVIARLEQAVIVAVNAAPCFIAVAGSFHGKSTGSLKLTYGLEFRKPWEKLGIKTVFVPREDAEALQREVNRSRITYPTIAYGPNGKAELQHQTRFNVAACFCEPIQGEGGIQVLSSDYMQAMRLIADECDFPLIIDEIQCGMGRCGTFLASSSSGVRGDYYLLSKSLGGGLAKISALMVDGERYDHEFGYLHTSTFADDDFSSAIALGVLDILAREDSAVMRLANDKGEKLLQGLRSLQALFPEQVSSVRGRGLMLGIEIAPQLESPSPLLRVLSEQNLISYLASGYLLHEHDIRIAPTLSRKAVLRIEPSAYISDESCDRFCEALKQFLIFLRAGDTGQLVRFMVGRKDVGPVTDAVPGPTSDRDASAATLPAIATQTALKRVAFLVHFTKPADLQLWDTRLRVFTAENCERFLSRTQGVLQPFLFGETLVRSATDDVVHLSVIGIPFTPEQALASMRDGSDWCLALVKQGVEMARSLGCTVIGLGGHTSVVSDSGRDLVEDQITLTSGNSLTVAAAHEALFKAAARGGLNAASCMLGVVGAAGNVGASMAELAADEVGEVLLIGRGGSERFLRPVAKRIYAVAFQRICAGRPDSGISAAIAQSDTVRALLRERHAGFSELSEKLYVGLSEELGDRAPVRISDSMDDLRACQLIVLATNAPRPVVDASHIGAGRVVICDVAVPQDIDSSVRRERPEAILLRGGIVRAPLGQRLGIPAMDLDGGEIYGCLAETLLLGFVRHAGHYSYGQLSAWRVRQAREWAALHGFEIAEKEIAE